MSMPGARGMTAPSPARKGPRKPRIPEEAVLRTARRRYRLERRRSPRVIRRMETNPSPDGASERQPSTGEGKRPGVAFSWRHFALNIFAPSVLTFVLFLVLIFAFILPSTRKIIVDRKKEMLRELVQTAWGEVEGLYRRELDGTMTRAAAQQAAVARIRELRYGEDRKDYFWISDLAPRMVMHPYRPDLDGTDLSNYGDPQG